MKEQIKTYLVAGYAFIISLLPNSVDECNSLLQLIATGLGIILVLWRFKVDVFRKKRDKWEDRDE